MASLAAGLQELELPFRATLELRYRRGLPDDTIAAVAGFDERVIQRQRQRALAWLAQRTALRGPDAIDTVEQNLRALSPEAWAGEPEVAAPEPEEPEAEESQEQEPEATAPEEPPTEAEDVPAEPVADAPRASMPPPGSPYEDEPREDEEPAHVLPTTQPSAAPESKSRGFRTEVSPRTAIGLLLLLLAVIALVFLLSSGDSADESGGAPPVPADPAKESGSNQGKDEKKPGDEAPAGGPVAMEPVPGADLGGGSIEVSLSGSGATPEIEITLHGLPQPKGEYRGWLYDSVIDSRTLGRARSGDGVIAATLPENWQDYPFLDVSIQKPDSITHSGESIARIPVPDLPAP